MEDLITIHGDDFRVTYDYTPDNSTSQRYEPANITFKAVPVDPDCELTPQILMLIEQELMKMLM